MIALMNRWADTLERKAAAIRARTQLRSEIMREVSEEVAAAVAPGDDLRLLMRVVKAHADLRYHREVRGIATANAED